MIPEQLRAELEAPEADARRRAVLALGAMPNAATEGCSHLLRALGDVDWRVRKEAVGVLARAALAPDLLQQVVDAVVQSENVGLRNSALEALAAFGELPADLLLTHLATIPESAKKFVIEGLGNTGSPRAVPALVAAVHSQDANTAAAAVDALSHIGGREAEQALRSLLASSDPFQRLAALDALTRLSSEVPYEELAPLFVDRMTQRVALDLLGRTGRVEALEPLTEALEDRSLTVAGSGAVGLMRLFDASPQLVEAVTATAMQLSPNARESLRLLVVEGALAVRQAAAHLAILAQDAGTLEVTLGLACEGALPSEALEAFVLWGVRAIEPLLDVHAQTSGLVSGMALELACDLALHARRTDAAAGGVPPMLRERVSAALDAHDEAVRRAAVRGLMACVESQDAGRLVTMLEHANEELASSVGEALRQLAIADPDAVASALSHVSFDWPGAAVVCELLVEVRLAGGKEALHAAQASASAQVRRAAVLALAKVHHPESAECVSLSLSDDDVTVRVAAAEALGVLGRALGVDVLHGSLRVALDADAPAVVAAAARALAMAHDRSAIPLLREKLASDRPGVAFAAFSALQELDEPLDALLPALARHSDEELAKRALRLAVESQSEIAVTCLRDALGHPAWHVRAFAVSGLMRIPEAASWLRERVRVETDVNVRRALEHALAGPEARGES